MDEFEIIRKYFEPLTQGRGVLDNDAAVLQIPAGQELVVTSDTVNAGTHFLESSEPAQIAHKALRVNLSDLAAMGASPLSYQLNIAFPGRPDQLWLERFTAALLADQKEFGIYCSGGDTTGIKGPLSISITALGLVPEGRAVERSGAKNGDAIILTGPVGDAYIGLKILQDEISSDDDPHFVAQYYKPRPRVDMVGVLLEYAHAAIDVSDGLLADIGHICRASDLAADIQLCGEILSWQAQELTGQGSVTVEELLSGGDDYILAVAVASENVEMFVQKVPGAFQIGSFVTGGSGVSIASQDGQKMTIKRDGWRHF